MRLPSLLFLLFILTASCSQVPKERTDKRPNILFVISDDQSFGHASAYGCNWISTPAFDEVARNGILFNHAYTPNAKCSPSRACILTGLNSWQLKEAGNHVPFFPEEFTTFPEVLSSNGYHVGWTGKGWAPGVAKKNGEPRDLIGKKYSSKTTTPPTPAISNNDYSANFQEFLLEKETEQPFFFWYGATEPHRGYTFKSGAKKGKKRIESVSNIPSFWPDNDTIRHDMLDYAFEIEHFDNHLGRILKKLEEIGELDNTLVIVTSDNGMPFPRIKGQTYPYDNHLPLAIQWTDAIENGNQICNEFVNFIDFAPTILEAAGIEEGATAITPMTGKSFMNILKSKASISQQSHRDHILIGKERHDIGRPHDQGYPVRGIINKEFAFIINFEPERWPAGNPETGYLNTDGSPTKTWILNDRRITGSSKYWDLNFGKRAAEELYDLKVDPWCINNLAKNDKYKRIRQELRATLSAELIMQKDPRMLGNGDIFDKYQYAHPATAGFYERFQKGEKMKTGWVNQSDYEKLEL